MRFELIYVKTLEQCLGELLIICEWGYVPSPRDSRKVGLQSLN